MIPSPIFVKKYVFSCWVGATSLPTDLLLNLTYILIIADTDTSDHVPDKLFTFHALILMSIFRCLVIYPKNPSKSKN